MKPPSAQIIPRLRAAAVIALGTTVIMSLLAWANPLEKWQLKLTNRFYDRNIPSQDILIVGIDEASLANDALGRWGSWSRTYYARAIENLENAGAKVIGMDLVLTQDSEGISKQALSEILAKNPTLEEYLVETARYLKTPHPDDQVLQDVFDEHENIVLGERFMAGSSDGTLDFIPLAPVLQGHVKTASLFSLEDEDGVNRRLPIEMRDRKSGEPRRTLSLEMMCAAGEAEPSELRKNLDASQSVLINYAAPPYRFPLLSFYDVYRNLFSREEVEGKYVLVGSVAEVLQDNAPTPTSQQTLMPGVEIHANALQTLLTQDWLMEQSLAGQIMVIAGLSLFLAFTLLWVSVYAGLGISMLTIAGYQLLAEPIFDTGLIVNVVYPTLALLIVYLCATLYKYTTEAREKNKIKGAFGKYVNKDLMEKILQSKENLKLGGEKKTVTVFFSDIANFTHFSERVTPDVLVAQLNEYFEVMAGIIMKNGGNVNKFDGDAIMAFWGAPIDEPRHAYLAAYSALECRAALRGLHERWAKESKPLLDFRVGLSTGEVIAGNVGSSARFDYTVMGDRVNLGSRLEGASKVYGTHILLPDSTASEIESQFELRRVDRLKVKGKDLPVEVYELLCVKGQLNDAQIKMVADFHAALDLYRAAKFVEAEAQWNQLLTQAPNDALVKTYLERCALLKQNPPGEGWDGSFTMTHK